MNVELFGLDVDVYFKDLNYASTALAPQVQTIYSAIHLVFLIAESLSANYVLLYCLLITLVICV